MEDETKLRTMWVGNLSSRVTDELLYELFLQAGPIENLSVPKDKTGTNRGYAFITYKHIFTLNYAIQLYDGTSLYDRKLRISPRAGGTLPHQVKNIEPPIMNSFTFEKFEDVQIPKNSPKIPSLPLPLMSSPIPLSQASLRGQWSHSSPYQRASPPKNHRNDSNRRYQERYQSSYYDRKRDDKNRYNRRK